MQLVIKLDLEKTELSLSEIFKLIGQCGSSDEAMEAAAGSVGFVRDGRGRAIGEWNIEEVEEHSLPLEPSYRAAAIARYVQPKQIEVDRFATVSLTDDGAFVQGWLYVPRADVMSSGPQASSPKPPRSVVPIRNAESKAG